MTLTTRQDAYQLLKELGAPTHLLRHLQLVGEAADALMHAYTELGLSFDAAFIEIGTAIHDAGKIEHPTELYSSGSLHEPAGEQLLLKYGVPTHIARCCVTHADWRNPALSLEERSIALADKLWKGKRETDLELLVIDQVVSRLGCDCWDVFSQLDAAFEMIAVQGDERLQRSVDY